LSPFKEILGAQVNTMRTALSLTSVDLDTFNSASLLTEYAAIKETFEKSLPVGGIIKDQEGDDRNETNSETRADRDAITVLGF